MDQAASDQPVTVSGGAPAFPSSGQPTSGGRRTEASRNGLAPQVRDVEAARMRLGHNLQSLNHEVRAQMGMTVEKLAWKLAVVGAAVMAAVGTRKALNAAWKAARHTDPPLNPADPGTAWGEALAWTAATGVTAAMARTVAQRAAAAGWQRATGAPPPGLASPRT